MARDIDQSNSLGSSDSPDIMSILLSAPYDTDLNANLEEFLSMPEPALHEGGPGFHHRSQPVGIKERGGEPSTTTLNSCGGQYDTGLQIMESYPGGGLQLDRHSCSCASQALSLVFARPTSLDLDYTGHEFDHDLALTKVGSTIEHAKKTTRSLDQLLQCTSPHDGYLLVILSLAISKLLEIYDGISGALHTLSTGHDEKTLENSAWAETNLLTTDTILSTTSSLHQVSAAKEGSYRFSAQELLSELHRVQRLIAKVSKGFRETALHAQRVEELQDLNPSKIPEKSLASEANRPFAPNLHDQIVEDLRRSVRVQSGRLIDMLQGT